MRRQASPLLLGVLAGAVICALAPAFALQRTASLMAGDIVTSREHITRSRSRSLIQWYRESFQQYTWVVGLHPDDQAQVHTTLQAHQGKLLHPLPGKDHHHWLVQATETAIHQLLKAHEDVTAALLPHSFKISPAIEDVLRDEATGYKGWVQLVVLLPEETQEGLTAIATRALRHLVSVLDSDCQVTTRARGSFVYITVCLKGAMEAVAWAAAQPAVTWVDIKSEMKQQSLYASAITQNPQKLHAVMDSDPTQPPPADVLKGTASDYFPLWKAGITGKGQVVAIVDSGIDPESCFFYDDNHTSIESGFTSFFGIVSDFGDQVNHTVLTGHRKIVELISVAGKIDTASHGTHTAGTIAGSQQGFNAQTDTPILGTGVCPDCKLAVIDAGPDLPGNESVYPVPREVFTYVEKTLGAKVSSESDGTNFYTYVTCHEVDKAAFDGSDLLHIFAAGNEGVSNRYLRNTNGTVSAQAICKNVIGVGAAQSWESSIEFNEDTQGEKIAHFNVLTPDGTVNNTFQSLYVKTLGPAFIDPATDPGILKIQQVTGQLETSGVPAMSPIENPNAPTLPTPVDNSTVVAAPSTPGSQGVPTAAASELSTTSAHELSTTAGSAPQPSTTTTSDGGFSLTLDGGNLDFIAAPAFNSDLTLFASLAGVFTREYRLVLADPLDACNLKASQFNNKTESIMLLVKKSSVDVYPYGYYDNDPTTCSPFETAVAAHDAGAAAVLLYWADNAYESAPYLDRTGEDFFLPMPMLSDAAVGDKLAGLLRQGITLKVTWTFQQATAPKSVLPFENVADFSGYGDLNVTSRTVIKPDIVAPGYQLSAYSDRKFTTGQKDQCAVVRKMGTSMATPVVSASAALTRQYFNDGFYPTGTATPANAMDPSAALVKAVLIAGTAAMTGYSIADGKRLAPPPSPYQGHGRVDLSTSLPLASNPEWRMAVTDNDKLAASGSYATYVLSVLKAQSGPQPDLIVTLVYRDFPGYPASFSIFPLVNDLDLSVTGPNNAAPVWGNKRENGDRVNNVEKVIIPQAAPGTYTIKVSAHYIYLRASPQTYSMVVLGNVQDFNAAGIQSGPVAPDVAAANNQGQPPAPASALSVQLSWLSVGLLVLIASLSSFITL